MQRVKAVMAHPDFEAYMYLNEKQEKDREFCCHQMQHALDVARIYYILCLEDKYKGNLSELGDFNPVENKELIYTIALLHDIGRWKEYLDDSLDHARESALLAGPILKDTGFTLQEEAIAKEAISGHRDADSRGLVKLLYRADKLSRNCKQCKAREKCYKLHKMETAESIVY